MNPYLSDVQKTQILGGWRAIGITDEADQRAFIQEVLGFRLPSLDLVTGGEAKKLIDTINQRRAEA